MQSINVNGVMHCFTKVKDGKSTLRNAVKQAKSQLKVILNRMAMNIFAIFVMVVWVRKSEFYNIWLMNTMKTI